jgi:hypothetical protein
MAVSGALALILLSVFYTELGVCDNESIRYCSNLHRPTSVIIRSWLGANI